MDEIDYCINQLNTMPLSETERAVKVRAAVRLGKIGGPRAVEQLIKNLRDIDPWVRANSAIALSKLSDPRILPEFVLALIDPEWEVRTIAVKMIKKSGDSSLIPRIIQLLRESDRDFQEAYLISALKELGELAVDASLEALRYPDIQFPIACVLGSMAEDGIEVDLSVARRRLKAAYEAEKDLAKKGELKGDAMFSYMTIANSIAKSKQMDGVLLEGRIKPPKKVIYRSAKGALRVARQ
ncbi:MAG: HEAT repeat domain-containing protein [Candidatus Micrarchaeota archaeon]